MPRPRVLSFISQWGGGSSPRSPNSSAPNSPNLAAGQESPNPNLDSDNHFRDSPKPPPTAESPRHGHSRSSSMAMTYQPPIVHATQDTPPELAPIFAYLNSHANKLYQEGYFLKLHDLDARGRPSADRIWNECFAQLVGTVLSLWDAAQLDAAGEDGEVVPTFVNLTDASIKMIESLPMNGVDGQSLQNVLSVSTAANNRYLLHFNSLHSLTQWTAGIRLAIYEHTTLQEAYTGSLIAGKGRYLNNIKTIMERSRFPTEDWVRVRFGAGTSWRRCWCVVTPPDEKEFSKVQKAAKKRSAYERAPTVKGDMKFYETKKVTKKTTPIATIKDAYAAYAVYPSSKDLIDSSTLIKVEGKVVVHSSPEVTTEGFVFIMPEVHPAVTGFEILIRLLLPIFDTFALYGRPNRLIADVVDPRSLMFAMPSDKRYGYLDLIDVAGLIHTDGSQNWSEYEWRKQMKQLTSRRMTAPRNHSRAASGSQQSSVNGSSRSPGVRYSEDEVGNNNSSRYGSSNPKGGVYSNPNSRNASDVALSSPRKIVNHQRASSDAYKPSRLSFETPKPGGTNSPPRPPRHAPTASQPPPQSTVPQAPPPTRATDAPPPSMHVEQHDQMPRQGPSNSMYYGGGGSYPTHQPNAMPPPPPRHGATPIHPMYTPEHNTYLGRDQFPSVEGYEEFYETNEYSPDSGDPRYMSDPPLPPNSNQPITAVAAPPTFTHKSNAIPPVRPKQMPELRRASSAIDAATLAQLQDANPMGASHSREFGRPPRARDDSQLEGRPLSPTRHLWQPGPMMQLGQMQRSMPQSQAVPPQDPRLQPSPMPYRPMPQPGSTPSFAPTSYAANVPSSETVLQTGPPPVTRGRPGTAGTVPRKALPPIPGTPAVEYDNPGLTPEGQTPTSSSRPVSRDKTVTRKPVPSPSTMPSRSPNPGRSPHTGTSPAPGRSPERQNYA